MTASLATDLRWEGHTLFWKASGVLHRLNREHTISHALALRSGGIAVIEDLGQNTRATFRSAAALLNSDGTTRATLENPFSVNERLDLYYFNYEGEQLVVFLAGALKDFRCIVNVDTGELSTPIESR